MLFKCFKNFKKYKKIINILGTITFSLNFPFIRLNIKYWQKYYIK